MDKLIYVTNTLKAEHSSCVQGALWNGNEHLTTQTLGSPVTLTSSKSCLKNTVLLRAHSKGIAHKKNTDVCVCVCLCIRVFIPARTVLSKKNGVGKE